MVDLENGSDDYYYAHDHLFSPAALFDNSGVIQERYEYDAYGKSFKTFHRAWSPF